jgi:hypothetical protein
MNSASAGPNNRAALVVESDEAFNPVDVGVLGPEGL